MQGSDRLAALRAGLQFVIKSDIPSDHKATLIEVLTQALRDHDAAELRRQAIPTASGEWQQYEIEQLKVFLQDRIAGSWQNADECVMHLAAQLQRDPRSIRDKAMHLGLGASVDYRLAMALRRARE